MDPTEFAAAEPHIEQIAELLDAALKSPELHKLPETLAALGKSLGERYSVTLSCLIEVSNDDGERTLPLLNTGLSTSGGAEPFRVSGDSTPHRYVMDGQMCVVPHDRCPKCWESWDFKWQHRHCPHCDAELGTNCKILLDSDVCPHCEEGRVTATKPKCTKCGFVVEPGLVVWG
jgi:hypothetical protein